MQAGAGEPAKAAAPAAPDPATRDPKPAPAVPLTQMHGIDVTDIVRMVMEPSAADTYDKCISGSHDLPMDTWMDLPRATGKDATVFAVAIPQLLKPEKILLLEHRTVKGSGHNHYLRGAVVLRSASVELRWAALFWLLDVPFFSELIVRGSISRKPDFYIPSARLVLEVKSQRPLNTVLQSYANLSAALSRAMPDQNIRVAVLWGQVRHGMDTTETGAGTGGDSYKYPYASGMRGVVWKEGKQLRGDPIMVLRDGAWDIEMVTLDAGTGAELHDVLGRATHPHLLAALDKLGRMGELFTHPVPVSLIEPGKTWDATKVGLHHI